MVDFLLMIVSAYNREISVRGREGEGDWHGAFLRLDPTDSGSAAFWNEFTMIASDFGIGFWSLTITRFVIHPVFLVL